MNLEDKTETSKKFHTCYGPVKFRFQSPGHTHYFLCADRDISLKKLEKFFPNRFVLWILSESTGIWMGEIKFYH